MQRWVPVFNTTNSTVPPFGAMQPSGGGINTKGELLIQQPQQSGTTDVFFNGLSPIPPMSGGAGTQDMPGLAAYTGSPTKGQLIGCVSGQWTLTTGNAGFEFLDGGNGVANIILQPAANNGSADLNYWRTSGVWYAGGQLTTGDDMTFAPTVANTFYAVPFVSGRGGVVQKLGVWQDSNPGFFGGEKLRMAIYDNTSNTNLTPHNLLVDSGDMSPNLIQGFFYVTISVSLAANSLYWMCLLTNAAGGGGGNNYVCGDGSHFPYPMLGIIPDPPNNTIMYCDHLEGAFTYGAYPGTAPALNPIAGVFPLPLFQL